MVAREKTETGFTIIEILISLAIAALLLTATTGLVNRVLETQEDTSSRNDTLRDGRFAMQRMIMAVLGTERLLLPLADNPNTNWREHVREETVPASAPEGASTRATAVLAVTLDPTIDTDADGFADGDNDNDGRVDEDVGADHTNDGAAGIISIDDDGDGLVDESAIEDDDEDEDQSGNKDEDRINSIDDDADGAVDEDFGADMNEDGQAGVSGFDDDGDGLVDESDFNDDDEDEDNDEDWLDPVVFFLNNSTLVERRPVLNPSDGADFSEYTIADNVTRFRVERIPDAGKRAVLVDITLDLTLPGGESVNLNTRIRVGGGS